jgi:hypothetical protein
MTMTATTCPDCGGTMQMGYTADRTGSSVPEQAFWVEGEPQRTRFAGLNMRDRAQLPIITLRCERCGLLKSYARPEDRRDNR